MMTVAERLKKNDLFRDLDLADIESLVARMPRLTFFGGDVVFNGGDVGDTMYIILSGRVRIYTYDDKGQEVKLLHYRAGEVFGEMALIDAYPRSASAMATEPIEVLALTRQLFLAFLVEQPTFGLALMRSLSQRLRNTTSYLERYRPSRFAVESAEDKLQLRRKSSSVMAQIWDKLEGDEGSSDQLQIADDTHAEDTDELPDLSDSEDIGIFDRIIAAMDSAAVAQDETHEEPN